MTEKRRLVWTDIDAMEVAIRTGKMEAIDNYLALVADDMPRGEFPTGPVKVCLDAAHDRIVLKRGADLYWLTDTCTVRQRGDELAYFRAGQAFHAPPGAN